MALKQNQQDSRHTALLTQEHISTGQWIGLIVYTSSNTNDKLNSYNSGSIEIYILKQNKQVNEYTILYIVYSHQ